ncbi:MAG TPA: 30S ribosomal protein S6 [Alphaproteobacteria bacterium]|nr:30S ribosomal protein S6 [Alphaproteobacteria bacterium]
MPLYETVFIARQDVSAKQVEDLASNFSKIVNDNGGETKRTESWGLRNLAYRIKKNRKGHYTLFHFDAPAKAMAEMERNMKLNEDVLRFMTVRIEKLPEGPSAILKQSDDTDERGSRGERGDRFDRGDRGDRGDRNERFDRGDRGDRKFKEEA